MKILLLLSLLAVISACSSLSKEECQSANWLTRGKSDALKGITEPKNTSYQEDCSEHGVTVDNRNNMKGYNEGLDLYCTYQNGYKLGLEDSAQHLYCQKQSIEFSKGYKLGAELFLHNKNKAQAVEEMKKQLISINGTMECPQSQICERETNCRFNKCVHNGMSCTFDQDCKMIGQCIPVTGYTRYGELASVNVCRFINSY